MLRATRPARLLRRAHAAVCSTRCRSSQAQQELRDVPAGHANSDLSDWACNTGLGRRRDITLRADVKLYDVNGSHTLREVFRDMRAVIIGLPDMGKICSEKHVPAYLEKAEELMDAGVEKMVCVAIAEPEKVEKFAEKMGISDGKPVQALADKKGSLARLLGVEKNGHTHRYSAFLDNGMLLKLLVEKDPTSVEVSSPEKIIECSKIFKKD